MDHRVYQKDYLRQAVAYFSLLCVLFSSYTPSILLADDDSMFVDEECEMRTRRARILAGVTVVVLAGGIAYAISSSSGKCHHHYSSYSSSCYSDYSSYSYYSSSCSDHSHHHHSHDHSSYTYSSYPSSIFSYNDVSTFSGSTRHFGRDPQYMERGIRSKDSQDSSSTTHPLSGVFIANGSGVGQGSITAFVQLPDGTRHILGSIPFSGHSSSSLPYGPFNQLGTYTFGISVDEGTILPAQARIGSVDIDVNGSTTQSHDFNVPSNPSTNYEPPPCSYTLT